MLFKPGYSEICVGELLSLEVALFVGVLSSSVSTPCVCPATSDPEFTWSVNSVDLGDIWRPTVTG